MRPGILCSVLLLMLLTACVSPAPDVRRPQNPLGKLSHTLHQTLENGELPAVPEDAAEARLLQDPELGVKSDYNAWIQACILYNRRLEDAQQYKPLPIVRELKENPLETPWRAAEWADTITGRPSNPFQAATLLLGQIAPAAAAPPTPPTDTATFADFRKRFELAAETIATAGWGELSAADRELLRFVLPWICRTGERFANLSKGAPSYVMNWTFWPNDPFEPGAETTSRFKTPVPERLYSMTGLYHYLRALAGEPVSTTGIRQDTGHPEARHPTFSAAFHMDACRKALDQLRPILTPTALAALRDDLNTRTPQTAGLPGVQGALLANVETPHGRIVVGGPGNNRYDNVDAAVIIDLGGDDEYLESGTPERLARYPVQVIIDYAGNDVYRTEEIGGPGAGILGVSLCIDLAGNDRYCQGLAADFEPRRHTRSDLLVADPEGDQTNIVPFARLYVAKDGTTGVALNAGFAFGAGFLGIGILHDHAGNDQYLGQKYAFGCGFWKGIGILRDDDGNDLYVAGKTSFGAGVNAGFGILDDRGGNDHYQCLGHHETSYSVGREWDNGYDGSGIGYGSAWRAEARSAKPEHRWQATLGGGLGLLRDHAGDDQYVAGSFSIGSGYAGGVGMVVDDAGNDTYFVKRGPDGSNHSGWSGNHSLANGCHRGLGYILDRDGNDRYSASSLGGGTAWDISSGFLLDLGGNDRMVDLHGKNQHGSTGKGMAKSLAVSFHYGGQDLYRRNSFGSAQTLAKGYPGIGGNFSFFFDIGAETDEYPKRYANDQCRTSGIQYQPEDAPEDLQKMPYDPQGYGLFCDGWKWDPPAP